MLTPDRLKEIHQQAITPIRGKLPEDIFVNYFLPYFVHREAGYPNEEKIVQDWISVAGGPYNEVDIIDTVGKPIFTVPSLMNTSSFNPNNESEIKYADLVATAEAYRVMSDVHANNFLQEALTVKFREVFAPTDKIFTAEQRWFAIFKRYPENLPAALSDIINGLMKKEEKQEQKPSAPSLDDEMIF